MLKPLSNQWFNMATLLATRGQRGKTPCRVPEVIGCAVKGDGVVIGGHPIAMMNYGIIPPVMSSSALSLQRVVGWWVTLLSTNPQIDLVKNR